MPNATFKTIFARRSIGNLTYPAPSQEELTAVLKLAILAPDHKKLTPWRFVVLSDEDSKAKLGQALLQAGTANAKTNGETADDTLAQKLLNMPNRAPLIIACITDYKQHEKVPAFEQLLSMGAAIQNMLLGFVSIGYQSIWRTGPLANSEAVRTLFDITGDNLLAGFVYVGSSAVVMPERSDVDISRFVTYQI